MIRDLLVAALLSAVFPLAGCGESDDSPGTGGSGASSSGTGASGAAGGSGGSGTGGDAPACPTDVTPREAPATSSRSAVPRSVVSKPA